jgi:predicted nucleic acid-binding protein
VGAVSVYFDTNVLLALFFNDAFTASADRIVRTVRDVVLISDFAAAEFSGVSAHRVLNRDLKAADARSAFSNFDAWCAGHAAAGNPG